MNSIDQTATKRGVPDSVLTTTNGLTVLKARYLKKNEKGEIIETPEQLFLRVAVAVASGENNYGTSPGAVEMIRDEFYRMMATGRFMPNSPTLMNAGRGTGLLSACFVLPIDDSIDSIFSSIRNTALIQKAGGGTGFSFSRLRPNGDLVSSSGGRTSGPISFMKVFSAATNAIQQGAFRRGANMGIMRIDHPDILQFINVKENLAELTNFNLSVGLTDEFMKALKENPGAVHTVRNPRTGETAPLAGENGAPWTVGGIFNLIVEKSWLTGEPGMIFLDRINEANPTPGVGPIEATNPCGEQPLLPYESCNLGSLNLTRFIAEDGDGRKFDFDAFRESIRLATRFLDNIIDVNRYPIPEIEQMTKGNRKIGLGLMGFADTLFALNIPYNSEEGVQFGEKIMKFLNDESHAASQKLAEERGVFPNWKGSVWEKRGIPMRNACTTTVAPTGTISIIANCTSGIEPLFSLVFYRNVLDGQRLVEVDEQFERVAREQGFHNARMMEQIGQEGSIQHIASIPEQTRRVFVTAHDIAPEWHIRMQAAFQKHCDAAISKTINFPETASPDDVARIYRLAFEQGCKGVTVYRNGCRKNQPMALDKKESRKDDGKCAEAQSRKVLEPVPLPDIMPAIRIKQITPFGNMHVKIVVDPVLGCEREIFAQLGKGGDLACSDLEAICRISSLYLRTNGSLREIMKQLDGIGSSLTIPTKDGMIASLADGLAIAIKKYMDAKEKFGLEAMLLGRVDAASYQAGLKKADTADSGFQARADMEFDIKCPDCGSSLIYEEGCSKCHCGYAKC